MAQIINVKLSRFDSSPWGFRLQGGKDFGTPLLIQKVNGGSLAEKAGLQAGDAVIKVNEVEVFSLRHKDAQDAIVKAGNNFAVTVQRGGSTWKPSVTPVGPTPTINSSPATNIQPVTKTSLAANKPAAKPIGTGHNLSAKPFGGPQVNGEPMVKSIVNKQYNTPVGMYSEESIAETLSAQAEVLAGGVLGVNFMKNEKNYNAANSEVFKMVQEIDSEPRDIEPEPPVGSAPVVSPPVTGLRHVSAPETRPTPTTPHEDPFKILPPGQNICADCERLIVGVFVRIKDKNLHVECFKCATCGTSLKNVGYYNINNKLYCDVHAKLAARQHPPAPNLEPIIIPPGGKAPAGTISAALSAATAPAARPVPGPTLAPASVPAPRPIPAPVSPSSPQTIGPLPFHAPRIGTSHVNAPGALQSPSSISAPKPFSVPTAPTTSPARPAPATSNKLVWPPRQEEEIPSSLLATAIPLYIPPTPSQQSKKTTIFTSLTQSNQSQSKILSTSQIVPEQTQSQLASSENLGEQAPVNLYSPSSETQSVPPDRQPHSDPISQAQEVNLYSPSSETQSVPPDCQPHSDPISQVQEINLHSPSSETQSVPPDRQPNSDPISQVQEVPPDTEQFSQQEPDIVVVDSLAKEGLQDLIQEHLVESLETSGKESDLIENIQSEGEMTSEISSEVSMITHAEKTEINQITESQIIGVVPSTVSQEVQRPPSPSPGINPSPGIQETTESQTIEETCGKMEVKETSSIIQEIQGGLVSITEQTNVQTAICESTEPSNPPQLQPSSEPSKEPEPLPAQPPVIETDLKIQSESLQSQEQILSNESLPANEQGPQPQPQSQTQPQPEPQPLPWPQFQPQPQPQCQPQTQSQPEPQPQCKPQPQPQPQPQCQPQTQSQPEPQPQPQPSIPSENNPDIQLQSTFAKKGLSYRQLPAGGFRPISSEYQTSVCQEVSHYTSQESFHKTTATTVQSSSNPGPAPFSTQTPVYSPKVDTTSTDNPSRSNLCSSPMVSALTIAPDRSYCLVPSAMKPQALTSVEPTKQYTQFSAPSRQVVSSVKGAPSMNMPSEGNETQLPILTPSSQHMSMTAALTIAPERPYSPFPSTTQAPYAVVQSEASAFTAVSPQTVNTRPNMTAPQQSTVMSHMDNRSQSYIVKPLPTSSVKRMASNPASPRPVSRSSLPVMGGFRPTVPTGDLRPPTPDNRWQVDSQQVETSSLQTIGLPNITQVFSSDSTGGQVVVQRTRHVEESSSVSHREMQKTIQRSGHVSSVISSQEKSSDSTTQSILTGKEIVIGPQQQLNQTLLNQQQQQMQYSQEQQQFQEAQYSSFGTPKPSAIPFYQQDIERFQIQRALSPAPHSHHVRALSPVPPSVSTQKSALPSISPSQVESKMPPSPQKSSQKPEVQSVSQPKTPAAPVGSEYRRQQLQQQQQQQQQQQFYSLSGVQKPAVIPFYQQDIGRYQRQRVTSPAPHSQQVQRAISPAPQRQPPNIQSQSPVLKQQSVSQAPSKPATLPQQKHFPSSPSMQGSVQTPPQPIPFSSPSVQGSSQIPPQQKYLLPTSPGQSLPPQETLSTIPAAQSSTLTFTQPGISPPTVAIQTQKPSTSLPQSDYMLPFPNIPLPEGMSVDALMKNTLKSSTLIKQSQSSQGTSQYRQVAPQLQPSQMAPQPQPKFQQTQTSLGTSQLQQMAPQSQPSQMAPQLQPNQIPSSLVPQASKSLPSVQPSPVTQSTTNAFKPQQTLPAEPQQPLPSLATQPSSVTKIPVPPTSSSIPNAGGGVGGGIGGGPTGQKGSASFAGSSAPRRGRGVLNQQTPGARIPLCGFCNSQIRGPFITALGKIWCPEHFICVNAQCRRPLQDIGFVEEKGELYCEFCFEQYIAPSCNKCSKKVKGDCLNAIGKQFHPECFLCAYCGKLFGNNPFYLEDGLPYCETDWNELFTTKCFACGFPIEAGDRWVEALNNNYHSQCFNCTTCKKNLEGQNFYAKGGRPFCKAHAR